jgi:hypothetical protein
MVASLRSLGVCQSCFGVDQHEGVQLRLELSDTPQHGVGDFDGRKLAGSKMPT